MGDVENSRVLFSFKCNAAEAIFANGGNEMLEAEFGEFVLPRDDWLPDWDVTLAISTAGFPKTKKVKKSMSEEEQEQIRQDNEAIRLDRSSKVDEIATKFSCFKRDFIGAPMRKALLACQAGTAVTQCEI